jgi:hypothetical protein
VALAGPVHRKPRALGLVVASAGLAPAALHTHDCGSQT